MANDARMTPLHHLHRSAGARTENFRGWDMPLWYPTGAVAEHRAVIDSVGMFDTSHMSVLMVNGPDSFAQLQQCFSRDLSSAAGQNASSDHPAQCLFGVFLDDAGSVLDDAVVFPLGPDSFLVSVNAGMGKRISDHLETCSRARNVQITDLTGSVGKIDLQGPQSGRVLERALAMPSDAFRNLRYFAFRGSVKGVTCGTDVRFVNKVPLLLSRTGYTGEFGFELFIASEHVENVWTMLLSAGEEFGIMTCGLAARDSLRAGAGLPLSQQDIGPWPFINNPWEVALPFTPDHSRFTKTFIGDVVLSLRDTADRTYAFVGWDPRKVDTHDHAVVLDEGGNQIGVVLTCVADMAIGRADGRIWSTASPNKPETFKPNGLCCGFVRVNRPLEFGQRVTLQDKRRKVPVEIVADVRPDRTAFLPIEDCVTSL
jgi:aminomethyltransferase